MYVNEYSTLCNYNYIFNSVLLVTNALTKTHLNVIHNH